MDMVRFGRSVWKDINDIIYIIYMFAFVARVWGVTSGSDDSVSFWNYTVKVLQIAVQYRLNHLALRMQSVGPKSPWFTNMTSKRGNMVAAVEAQPLPGIVANRHGLRMSAMQATATSALTLNYPSLY